MTNYYDNPYFSRKELCCKLTGDLVLARRFLDSLILLRRGWNQPMKVNSCCRSVEHNQAVGGSNNSRHLITRDGTDAIDIAMIGGADKWAFVKLAMQHGWSVGVYKTFVHIDKRPGNPVMWSGS